MINVKVNDDEYEKGGIILTYIMKIISLEEAQEHEHGVLVEVVSQGIG